MAGVCAAEGVDHPGYLLRLSELELIDRHLHVPVDGSFQVASALMHTPAQLLIREQCEPTLHQVQPGGAGWREVHMEPGTSGKPVPYQCRLVGSVVVGNQMHLQVGRHLALNCIEELAELGAARCQR